MTIRYFIKKWWYIEPSRRRRILKTHCERERWEWKFVLFICHIEIKLNRNYEHNWHYWIYGMLLKYFEVRHLFLFFIGCRRWYQFMLNSGWKIWAYNVYDITDYGSFSDWKTYFVWKTEIVFQHHTTNNIELNLLMKLFCFWYHLGIVIGRVWLYWEWTGIFSLFFFKPNGIPFISLPVVSNSMLAQ